ncbi:MAG: glycosyltransferase family 39 protein, partial [Anaerolineae bacterium]
SFATLNASTFPLSLTAVLASYALLRELGLGPILSLLGAAALLVNPAMVLLSYSYMTDVPFLAWMSLALWMYVRGVRRGGMLWYGLGAVFAGLAVLVRQNGIVLPAALGAYLLWAWLRRRRPFPWREGLAGILLPALALLVLMLLPRLGIMPARANALMWIDRELSIGELSAKLFRLLLYMGLFLLPISAAVGLRAFLRREGWKEAWKPALFTALAGAGALWQFHHPFKLPYIGTWRMMPYYPAVWTPFGTGNPGEWLAGQREMLFSYRFWVLITALSCVGVGLLLWPALRRRTFARDEGGNWPAGLLWLVTAANLAPLVLFRGEIYERYLLVVLVPAVALFLRSLQREGVQPSWPAAGALLALYLAFSLALTAEFVGWNGAVWRAAERLSAQGVPLEQLDGGFAWNGWHFADRLGQGVPASEAGAPAYMELFPFITRQYVVSFSPLAGYQPVGEETYRSPLRGSMGRLYILRRAQ